MVVRIQILQMGLTVKAMNRVMKRGSLDVYVYVLNPSVLSANVSVNGNVESMVHEWRGVNVETRRDDEMSRKSVTTSDRRRDVLKLKNNRPYQPDATDPPKNPPPNDTLIFHNRLTSKSPLSKFP